MTRVFVPAVGQYDNIGDIILRRPLLEVLRRVGQLHIYLGRAPSGYRDGLALADGDVVYESFARWYAAMIRSALTETTHYAFKPGEIQLSITGMKEHVGMLPALLILGLRHGRIVRVGSGARSFARLPRLLMQPSLALARFTAWRDADTATYLGHGETMPDFGFHDNPEHTGVKRSTLVLSMRGDRPSPGIAWLDAMRAFAGNRGLEIVVATQVGRDDALSKELAAALGAKLVSWDGLSHDRQETRLRELYRGAVVVVSDRLHVLIAATTEGAQPLAVLTAAAPKIDRHFTAAGLPSVTLVAAHLDAADIATAMEDTLNRNGDLSERLSAARKRIDEVGATVVSVLRTGS